MMMMMMMIDYDYDDDDDDAYFVNLGLLLVPSILWSFKN